VFCIYLRTNSDFCHLGDKLTSFYNQVEKRLQHGTNWVCKLSSLHFVFKRLNIEQPVEDIMLPQMVAEHLEQAGHEQQMKQAVEELPSLRN
jgi:hypothetical protein